MDNNIQSLYTGKTISVISKKESANMNKSATSAEIDIEWVM